VTEREENAEIVRFVIDAWNSRDVDAFLGHFDPDCEVIFPPDVPEPGPFRGHAELRGWAEGFVAAWESHRAEVVEAIDAGDTILVTLRLVGRGSGSGIEMDETDTHLFTVRNGRITHWQNFNERADALAAAGLSD
jgi:ketosteroid isomerase-like protein